VLPELMQTGPKKKKKKKKKKVTSFVKKHVTNNFALKSERAFTSLIYFGDCLSLTTNYFSNTALFVQFTATGYMFRLTN
jgi:protoporphyrinogen oxidase